MLLAHNVPVSNSREQALDLIERTMVGLRRSMSRRSFSRQLDRAVGEAVSVSHALVIDALENRKGTDIDVGGVAMELGIDPSRASRMVAHAIRAGYVRRYPSQLDGRRSSLQLTESGQAVASAARVVRISAFGQAVAKWTEEECEVFAALLARFSEALIP
jgi:DNA-binding MarR family transcriptional regulator